MDSNTYISFAKLSEKIDSSLIDKLIKCYAGEKIYIPKEMHKDHHFARCLGMAYAEILSLNFGTKDSLVPKVRDLKLWESRAERDRLIVDGRKKGECFKALACQYNMTTRTIQTICKKAKEAENG